jgi:hypothetical protein
LKDFPGIFYPFTEFSEENFTWAYSCVMTRAVYVDVDKFFHSERELKLVHYWNGARKSSKNNKVNVYALGKYIV